MNKTDNDNVSNSHPTKTVDILHSLHSIFRCCQLSEEQIKHIYFHECKQDFKQSV